MAVQFKPLVFSFFKSSKSFPTLLRTLSTTPPTPTQRKYTPRRTLMYVPGNDDRKLSKIPQLGADCICLDCEDGVSVNKKVAARENIAKLLETGEIDFGRSECSVRVNSVDSGLCEEDMEAILGGDKLPHAVHLPKVENVEQLEWFAGKFNAVIKKAPERKIGLIMFVESAAALIDLPNILRASVQLSDDSFFVPEAVVFGSDDFVADIGATRTPEATELVYARQAIVTAAKAFRLQAIDLVHIDYKDLEGLERQSIEGARMGFTGKQVIHPGQISVVNQAFSPSADRIAWAKELVEEFRVHENEGKGAFTFRGAMIDMPLVKQAINILQMADMQ